MKEALKLALEALEKSTKYFNIVRLGESRLKDTEIRGASHAAITAIKEALAQSEQEPVGWAVVGNGKFGKVEIGQHAETDLAACSYWVNRGYSLVPCYTAPPKRPWVGLTAEEIEDCMEMSIQKTCRAIEAKLKELNT